LDYDVTMLFIRKVYMYVVVAVNEDNPTTMLANSDIRREIIGG